MWPYHYPLVAFDGLGATATQRSAVAQFHILVHAQGIHYFA
jgi:hypothetical protein